MEQEKGKTRRSAVESITDRLMDLSVRQLHEVVEALDASPYGDTVLDILREDAPPSDD